MDLPKRIMKFSCALVLVCLLAGCANVHPTKSYVRRGPNYSEEMPAVDRVGIFVDAVVHYDRVSTNYIDIEDSLAATTNLLREGRAAMATKGYEVAFVESPFVGAWKSPSLHFSVAEKRKDEPAPRDAPFVVAPDLDPDAAYRDAVLRANRDIFNAVFARGELPTEHLRSVAGLLF